tara:strand:+ start:421 stop:579 length:159 start_codon:yes stop_codon:yes gene_type:complete
MNTLNLTSAEYLKGIELGFLEPIKCLSVFEKKVTLYKLCGRKETVTVKIKNK